MYLKQPEGATTPIIEEIENLILGHAAVKNIACVSMPDPVLGEKICACVIPHDNATLQLADLNAYLVRQEIAKFKLPERLELLDDFPLSTFGKVSKKDLVAMVTEKLRLEGSSG